MSAVRTRRDRRLAGLGITLVAVLGGGSLVDRWPTAPTPAPAPPAAATAAAAAMMPAAAPQAHARQLQQRFEQAVVMLHARQYAHAATALHQVLLLAPELPEAHVNMGYAMLGLNRPKEARDFFDSATALRPDQANAYYGLALAYEAAGDPALATGAMRSYLHLAQQERPEHLRRARAALWEWEQAQAQAQAQAQTAGPAGQPSQAGAPKR